MDEMDDPITLTALAIGAGGMGVMAATETGPFADKNGGFGGMPSSEAEQATATAAPVTQLSEQAKKTKRLKASMLTRDWGGPKLGMAGLLGG